jgi:tRNA(fMet)-specific endonuclease VapC
MSLILDTNAVSAIAEGEHGASKQFIQARQVAIPVIVLGEYRYGLAQSRYRHKYEHWLGELISACTVLHVDEETAVFYAGLRGELKEAGTPIPSNDTWIAALARQHSLPILSRDRHFDLIKGLKRDEW